MRIQERGESGADLFLTALVLMVSIIVIGLASCEQGFKAGVRSMQRSAVENGHGTYDVAPDGTTTFKWRAICLWEEKR